MHNRYESPLSGRYASDEMQEIFSSDRKFGYWRRLWIALAESEQELGLDITDDQIAELKNNVDNIDYEAASRYEKDLRHDVMAHIHTYGDSCPTARAIIHLGATSSYVGDNTDLLQQREALLLIKRRLVSCIAKATEFAKQYKSLACLAFTHFQPAQPTTVGKRATLWINEMMLDLEQLNFVIDNLKFFGCKGTTGTAASFVSLFEGDVDKVLKLEQLIAKRMNFDSVYPVGGQTYSRKVDFYIMSVLSGIAQSSYKFSNDIRLLSNLREVEEPFESGQVGSSAMAYKRNPMRSERIASLARYVMADTLNPALTASSQWFERTLDDSANRRIAIPEAFLAVDSILLIYSNIIGGLRVFPKVIKRRLDGELPFMATENILMHCVKQGKDRQSIHELIRKHSVAAATAMKEGEDGNLLNRMAEDEGFGLTLGEIEEIIEQSNLVGIAELQTDMFLTEVEQTLQTQGVSDDVEVELKV